MLGLQQPDPRRTANDRRKPLARYSAMESALASGSLRPSYTINWDTDLHHTASNELAIVLSRAAGVGILVRQRGAILSH